ncbi:MAG: ABC transporter permease subunit [Myxococcales bacterium]|nr:MAG: ABC transporter permease subunit [Myxococcales bacterium]
MKLALDFRAAFNLDLAEALRSRWVLFSTFVTCLLAAVFIFVGMRESTVMGFTGMGRALLSFSHTLLLILPLLALAATGQVMSQAREDGTFELLFSHPITPWRFFAAVSVVRYLVIFVPLLFWMVGMAAYDHMAASGTIQWSFLLRVLLLSAALLWCYVALGLTVSIFVRNQARAMIYLLLIWALSAAFIDFGIIALMLRWKLQPEVVFVLAVLNPLQAARMALLAGINTDLAVLGPVGHFLGARLGASWLLVIGVAWPVVVGCVAWMTSFWSLRHDDLL